MKGLSRKKRLEGLMRSEARWTTRLIASGFTVIPAAVLANQRALGLDPQDINILLYLAGDFSREDDGPGPSKRFLARAMGVDVSTIRRRLAKMERLGLIERLPRMHPSLGQQANEYSLDGLIEKASSFAREQGEDRKKAPKKARAKGALRPPDIELVLGGRGQGKKG